MNQGTNEKQIAYWNETGGPKWVRLQEELDAQLAPLADAMMETALIEAESRVLDVGCGCGATTLAIARRVERGSVIGVDASEPMLDHARNRAKEEGLNNIEFLQADAQVYAFEERAFDVVTSRFGVMFFEDARAAFSNFRRALRSGGRLSFVCWQALEKNPRAYIPRDAAAQHLELPEPPGPGEPGPFSLAEEDYLRYILSTAGFEDVQIESWVRDLPTAGGASLDDAVEFIIECGPLARPLAEVEAPVRLKVRDAVREAVRPYHTPDGLVMTWAVWRVTATAP